MCFFKKKKKTVVQIDSKYKKGDYVNFRYKDELYFGWIWSIYYKNIEGKPMIAYDIQIAGQCPTIVRGILEEKVIGIKKN